MKEKYFIHSKQNFKTYRLSYNDGVFIFQKSLGK